MADGSRRPSEELARTTSNAQIDTSAPFENVKAARSIFETGGEKGKVPMPSVARSGSAKSGDWLSKQQGFASPRSRANSFEEKQRSATVASPNSATSEFRGYVSPSAVQKGDKLEADLKAAQAQLEEAQTRATALQEASNDEEAKRLSLERKLADYKNTMQQLEEKLAREQAEHSAAKERAGAEMQKLQAALEKSQADHEDKTKQVAAALTAMQTTTDAHSATQDELAAVHDELASIKVQLAEARSEVQEHKEALAAAEKRAEEALVSVHVAKKEAAAAVEAEGRAKADVAAVQSEVELAKKTNATLESRLEAAAKELEVAQHAEEVATKRAAEEQAAREKGRAESTAAPALASQGSDVAVYKEELSRFQGRIAEAEALADKRVAAATAQLDASRLAEEETKAKLDALSTGAAAAKSAENNLREKLEAAVMEAEQAKRALQVESDKVHNSGVTITIAQAKEKEAVEKLAVVQKEREALEAELSEWRKKHVALQSNGDQRAHKADQRSTASISEIQQESATEPAKALPQREPANALPPQEPAKTKSQPKCCVVM